MFTHVKQVYSKEPTLQMLREKYTFIDIMHPQQKHIFSFANKKNERHTGCLKRFQLAKNNKDEGLVYKYLKQSYRFAETTYMFRNFSIVVSNF